MKGHDEKPKEIKVDYLASFYNLPIEKPISTWSEDEESLRKDFSWHFNNFPHKISCILNDYEILEKDVPIRVLTRMSDEEVNTKIQNGIHSERYYNGTINDFNGNILNALTHNNIDIVKLKRMFEENGALRNKITDLRNESRKSNVDIDQKLIDDAFYGRFKILELLIPVFSDLLDMGYTRVDLAG